MEIDIEKTIAGLRTKGLSQVEIAAEIGCTQAAISAMSNGKIGKKRPSYRVVDGLKSLAARHGVNLATSNEVAPTG